MARTRGASRAYADTHIAQLDRQGNPISPAAAHLNPPLRMNGNAVVHGPGAEPVAPDRLVAGYRCAPDTWARDMDAWELANLLHILLQHSGDLGEGFLIELKEDEFLRLNGNLRRHFMAVRA